VKRGATLTSDNLRGLGLKARLNEGIGPF
jgi:hypothetical protein